MTGTLLTTYFDSTCTSPSAFSFVTLPDKSCSQAGYNTSLPSTCRHMTSGNTMTTCQDTLPSIHEISSTLIGTTASWIKVTTFKDSTCDNTTVLNTMVYAFDKCFVYTSLDAIVSLHDFDSAKITLASNGSALISVYTDASCTSEKQGTFVLATPGTCMQDSAVVSDTFVTAEIGGAVRSSSAVVPSSTGISYAKSTSVRDDLMAGPLPGGPCISAVRVELEIEQGRREGMSFWGSGSKDQCRE
ncbi:hypothetical protein HDU98_009648 [Podochytrium sp. JEL0797]|nr:hypothetical protein HDU98_009648 [Podochytrium sp. JEL0797]